MTKQVDGSAAGVLVELSARLVDQLSLVALGTAPDGAALAADLGALMTTLHEAVSGYAGLALTLVHGRQPVRLTALVPGRAVPEVVSSLRLALDPVSSAFEEGGRLVVWSTTPGSLVDLGADLGYVFGKVVGGDRPRSSTVRLDQDLPPPGTTSGVDGLDELAVIHRATGLLISQGHPPGTVDETLRSQAHGDGSSPYARAVGLLDAHQASRQRGSRRSPEPEPGTMVERDV